MDASAVGFLPSPSSGPGLSVAGSRGTSSQSLGCTTSVPAIAWYVIDLPSTVTEPLLLTASGLNGSKRCGSGLSAGLGGEPGAPGGGGAAATQGTHDKPITQAPNT